MSTTQAEPREQTRPMSEDSRPAFDISDRTRVRLPLFAWIALLASVSTAAGAYYVMRDDVQRNKADIVELKIEAKSTRELLIRIDANVAALKERK